MGARLLSIILALAVTAHAQTSQKWQMPDGRIVYGDKAPPGATVLESYESAAPERPSEEAEKGDAPAAPDAAAAGRAIIKRRQVERAARDELNARQQPLGVRIVGDTRTVANQGGSLVSFCYESNYPSPMRVLATIGPRRFDLGVARSRVVECAAVDTPRLGYFRISLEACDPASMFCRP